MKNTPNLSPGLGVWRNTRPAEEEVELPDLANEFGQDRFGLHDSITRAWSDVPATLPLSNPDSGALDATGKKLAAYANLLRTAKSPLNSNILKIWEEEHDLDSMDTRPNPEDYTHMEWQLICSATAARSKYDPRHLAALCAISLRQLERQFKAVFASTPREWLNEIRMVKARRLLARSNSIKEVAYSLFYKQPSHFTREFKGRFGVTPTQFRDLDGSTSRRSIITVFPDWRVGKQG